MPVLKSLSFTAMPKSANDPVYIRRVKFIEKLEEQKLLLQDPGYVRTAQRMVEVDGQTQAVVRRQRVRPWWKMDSTGQIIMSVKFGAKPIEFETGTGFFGMNTRDMPCQTGEGGTWYALLLVIAAGALTWWLLRRTKAL